MSSDFWLGVKFAMFIFIFVELGDCLIRGTISGIRKYNKEKNKKDYPFS